MEKMFYWFAAQCGNVQTTLIDCGTGSEESGIYSILALAVNILTIGIGAGGVIGIIISGIQYMTANGDPATMTKAKRRIVEVLIGLGAFAVLWAFLEWLIPGGVLHS
jgi:hypothetical protein